MQFIQRLVGAQRWQSILILIEYVQTPSVTGHLWHICQREKLGSAQSNQSRQAWVTGCFSQSEAVNSQYWTQESRRAERTGSTFSFDKRSCVEVLHTVNRMVKKIKNKNKKEKCAWGLYKSDFGCTQLLYSVCNQMHCVCDDELMLNVLRCHETY